MKTQNGIAYVRQLCCLGLPKETLIAELLRAIKTVLPSSGNVFVGLGENHYPGYVIPEFVVPEALTEFTENTPKVVTRKMMESTLAYHRDRRILDDPEIVWEGFYKGDLYNLVWRPYDQYHCLQALLRISEVECGLLSLFRSRAQKGFSEAEKNRFEQLLPYLEHGLQFRKDMVTEYGAGGESGMFILDGQGRLVSACASARNLLTLARYPSYPTGSSAIRDEIPIPPVLGQLGSQLNGIFQGRAVPPPVLHYANGRGRFIFRAYWLDSDPPEPGRSIGVTVEHQEPAELRYMRGMNGLPLSPAQMQACLLLAQNRSHEEIARHANIRMATVKDHVRAIYDKLGINRREELQQYLLRNGSEK